MYKRMVTNIAKENVSQTQTVKENNRNNKVSANVIYFVDLWTLKQQNALILGIPVNSSHHIKRPEDKKVHTTSKRSSIQPFCLQNFFSCYFN